MAHAPWERLLNFDRRHIWHPYGPLPAAGPALGVVSAQGTRLRLSDGREVVDAMSSWWTAIWGYRHPAIDAAVQEQLSRMAHVMFGGLTHEPAILLAERLVDMAPPGLDNVFFADSGSVAVEVALKACVQFQESRGRPGRTKFLALAGGYHGDTLGAMSVCDPIGGMHHLFPGFVPVNFFAPRPPAGPGVDAAWEASARRLAAEHAHEIAAVVAEPVVQGAGGMWFYDPAYLKVLREICDEQGALLVLDEIATGFGRTGALFACLGAGVTPDLMCIGKALSGGYMTLAAVLCSSEVAHAVSGGQAGGLVHGPTFMANPLACAAALASTQLIVDGGWQNAVSAIEAQLCRGLSAARDMPGVKDVRALGAIGVVQLEREVDVAAATSAALAHGVWARPFRDLIYTMPPYISTPGEVGQICAAILAAAEAG